MVDCVVIIPVLRRPHRAEPVLSSLRETTSNARALFICSPGDQAEIAAAEATGADHIVVSFRPTDGDFARKVNLAYRESDEPLIFLGADDLRFHEGWLEAATRQLKPGVGVVGTNDMGSKRVQRGVHSTHSLVTRAYADKFGTIDEKDKILHEGYPHEYVDDELVGTARKRKAWAFAVDSIVEHLHPNWNKAPMDELYARQSVRTRQGAVIFVKRRRLWM